jgi:hypothetical protein
LAVVLVLLGGSLASGACHGVGRPPVDTRGAVDAARSATQGALSAAQSAVETARRRTGDPAKRSAGLNSPGERSSAAAKIAAERERTAAEIARLTAEIEKVGQDIDRYDRILEQIRKESAQTLEQFASSDPRMRGIEIALAGHHRRIGEAPDDLPAADFQKLIAAAAAGERERERLLEELRPKYQARQSERSILHANYVDYGREARAQWEELTQKLEFLKATQGEEAGRRVITNFVTTGVLTDAVDF